MSRRHRSAANGHVLRELRAHEANTNCYKIVLGKAMLVRRPSSGAGISSRICTLCATRPTTACGTLMMMRMGTGFWFDLHAVTGGFGSLLAAKSTQLHLGVFHLANAQYHQCFSVVSSIVCVAKK